ncbi:MAG: NIL domain-containing protein [Candidatus Omnitrophica bacterium]|nr:NIL domain-containing protein [Candidatus Omnitrophota bacterium]
MAKRAVTLIFPQHLIKEPVIYTLAKKFNLVPNIRRAKITETVGEVTLEIEGSEADLKNGLQHLEAQGVKVEPVTGDIVS